MKKIFVSVVMLALATFSAMAGSDLNVVNGDNKFFATNSGNAVLEFVFEGATYDDKMPLNEKFTDMRNLEKIAISGLTDEFNDTSKKIKIISEVSSAQYKISFKVSKMDQYFKVMGFIPSNATKVWGTITVTNIATGETLLVVDVNEVDGGANPSPDETISDCFEEVGEQLAKLK